MGCCINGPTILPKNLNCSHSWWMKSGRGNNEGNISYLYPNLIHSMPVRVLLLPLLLLLLYHAQGITSEANVHQGDDWSSSANRMNFRKSSERPLTPLVLGNYIAPVSGSHGLSGPRARRRKSSRPEGHKLEVGAQQYGRDISILHSAHPCIFKHGTVFITFDFPNSKHWRY